MEIHPVDQIQSISEFRTKTEELLKSLERVKSILLTQHGKTRAVLVDPRAYQEQLDKLRLVEKILQSEKEIEEGKGTPHSKVERLSKSWVK